MDWHDFIEERLRGMPLDSVLKGTRITVGHVLRELAEGKNEEDLLRQHPSSRTSGSARLSPTPRR